MSDIRDLGETDESEVKIRFAGGSHRKDPNTRTNRLSVSVTFPEGTNRTEAKEVLSELLGKEFAIELEVDNE